MGIDPQAAAAGPATAPQQQGGGQPQDMMARLMPLIKQRISQQQGGFGGGGPMMAQPQQLDGGIDTSQMFVKPAIAPGLQAPGGMMPGYDPNARGAQKPAWEELAARGIGGQGSPEANAAKLKEIMDAEAQNQLGQKPAFSPAGGGDMPVSGDPNARGAQNPFGLPIRPPVGADIGPQVGAVEDPMIALRKKIVDVAGAGALRRDARPGGAVGGFMRADGGTAGNGWTPQNVAKPMPGVMPTDRPINVPNEQPGNISRGGAPGLSRRPARRSIVR